MMYNDYGRQDRDLMSFRVTLTLDVLKYIHPTCDYTHPHNIDSAITIRSSIRVFYIYKTQEHRRGGVFCSSASPYDPGTSIQ